jgi:dihydrofolate reductase
VTVRADLGISLDGYATGEGQSQQAPFGHAGTRLLDWFAGTPAFRTRVLGQPGARGTAGVDDAFALRYFDRIGAEIMGANKFGPPGWQQDAAWRGWWGEDPPFHTPVFVLTHHPRPTLEMDGGTTFHFLDASPKDALAVATEAAGDLDVRIGGGPTTVREFLAAGLVDQLHVAVVPLLLGRGVRLWDGLEGLEASYAVEAATSSSGVTHISFSRLA